MNDIATNYLVYLLTQAELKYGLEQKCLKIQVQLKGKEGVSYEYTIFFMLRKLEGIAMTLCYFSQKARCLTKGVCI